MSYSSEISSPLTHKWLFLPWNAIVCSSRSATSWGNIPGSCKQKVPSCLSVQNFSRLAVRKFKQISSKEYGEASSCHVQSTMKQRKFSQGIPLLYNVFFVSLANIIRGDVSLRATRSQVTQWTTGQTDGSLLPQPPPEPHPVTSAVLWTLLGFPEEQSNCWKIILTYEVYWELIIQDRLKEELLLDLKYLF